MANGRIEAASAKAIVPIPGLSASAKTGDILLSLKDNLLYSVSKLADASYYTIFHPEDAGVTIHDGSKSRSLIPRDAVLQGWREENGQ